MPTVEKTAGGRVYVRNVGQHFEVGDQADVSEADAAYLCEERGDFERVDSDVEMTSASGEGLDEVLEDDAEKEVAVSKEGVTVEEEEAAPDVDEWHDWNEDDWLDVGYEQRADDVHEGRVDDHLDAIEAVETSETVTDAVQDRRAELEEE